MSRLMLDVRYLLLLFAAAVLLLQPRSAIAQTSVTMSTPDVSAFPVIQMVVRPTDATGSLAPGLQADQFRIDESTEAASINGIMPDVQTLAGGPAFAVSLVLDTRNQSSREELNAVRDYARNVVTLLGEIPSEMFAQERDLIEIWSPGLQPSPVVGFDGALVENINAINTTLPYEGTSQGLDRVLSEVIANTPPGNLPHVVLLIGKIAEIEPDLDATVLANQANRSNVAVYVANIGDDQAARDYLKSLTLSTGGKYYESEQVGGVAFVNEMRARFKGQYLLTYRSGLTPYPPYHTIVARVDSPSVSGEARASVAIPTIPLPGAVTTARLWIFGLIVVVVLALLALLRASHCAGARLLRRMT